MPWSRHRPGFQDVRQADKASDMLSACRCVTESGFFLLLAAQEAEQHDVLYSLATAARMLTYAVVILVAEAESEGAAAHQALSAACTTQHTACHDIRLTSSDQSSWQELLAADASSECILSICQGGTLLIVPNCQPALALLAAVLAKVNPAQLLLLAAAAAIPPPEAQNLQARRVRLPCSSFVQVGPDFSGQCL